MGWKALEEIKSQPLLVKVLLLPRRVLSAVSLFGFAAVARAPFTHAHPSRRGISILPVPNSLQELHHVYSLTFHFNHPGMLQHAPRRGAAFGLFFEATSLMSV